ncbi:MAG: PfkB family carbohydrate kinase [Methanobacterium sp.]|jgi:sugar/nucleoside kinase (ribokinase family)|uniref:PfkB family carbohydrate kinase n=1 Tax=Methanobacterium sp. TaxID=2164 RepID=UPI0028052FFF|nr:PfkB family carbohydrate kinase [uncultured Methanobacterium sp.]
MAKFLLLGPLTRDTNLKGGSTCRGIGGPVYYQAGVLSSLKSEVTAVVTLGKDDAELLTYFSKNVQLKPIWGEETMQFENFYPDQDPNHRVQRACMPINPLELSHLDFLESESFDAVLISPLSPEDIPLSTIKYIFKIGIPIYLGVQGYLRHLEGHKVVLKPWNQYKNFLKYVNFLFMDEVEARMITGDSSTSLLEISRDLSILGPEEVIITRGDQGSLIYSRYHNKFYSIPAYPPKKRVDPTGLGDSYLAAYAFQKQETSDPEKGGIFSSIVSSLKLEKKGAFNGDRELINRRIQELKLCF